MRALQQGLGPGVPAETGNDHTFITVLGTGVVVAQHTDVVQFRVGRQLGHVEGVGAFPEAEDHVAVPGAVHVAGVVVFDHVARFGHVGGPPGLLGPPLAAHGAFVEKPVRAVGRRLRHVQPRAPLVKRPRPGPFAGGGLGHDLVTRVGGRRFLMTGVAGPVVVPPENEVRQAAVAAGGAGRVLAPGFIAVLHPVLPRRVGDRTEAAGDRVVVVGSHFRPDDVVVPAQPGGFHDGGLQRFGGGRRGLPIALIYLLCTGARAQKCEEKQEENGRKFHGVPCLGVGILARKRVHG